MVNDFLSFVIVKPKSDFNNFQRLLQGLIEKHSIFYTILIYQNNYYYKIRIKDVDKNVVIPVLKKYAFIKNAHLFIDEYWYEEKKYLNIYKNHVEDHFILSSKFINDRLIYNGNDKFQIFSALLKLKLKYLKEEEIKYFLNYSTLHWKQYSQIIDIPVKERSYEFFINHIRENKHLKIDNSVIEKNFRDLYIKSIRNNGAMEIPYFRKNGWNDYLRLIFCLNHMDANKLEMFPAEESNFYRAFKEVYFEQ